MLSSVGRTVIWRLRKRRKERGGGGGGGGREGEREKEEGRREGSRGGRGGKKKEGRKRVIKKRHSPATYSLTLFPLRSRWERKKKPRSHGGQETS